MREGTGTIKAHSFRWSSLRVQKARKGSPVFILKATVESLCHLQLLKELGTKKNIVVISEAGISTNAGGEGLEELGSAIGRGGDSDAFQQLFTNIFVEGQKPLTGYGNGLPAA